MLNWLYGPRIDPTFPGYIVLRSLRLDIDAVRDVYRIVNEKSGPAVLTVAAAPGLDSASFPAREISLDELGQLSDSETLRLMVRSGGEEYLAVDFRNMTQPSVTFDPQRGDRTAMEIATFLLAEGKPRIKWSLVRRLPAAAVALVIAVVGGGLIYAQPSGPWPHNVLASGLVFFAAAFSAEWVQRRHDARWASVPRLYAGHRVSATTREHIRTLRAQTHRDVKVFLITFPIGAVAGVLLERWLP